LNVRSLRFTAILHFRKFETVLSLAENYCKVLKIAISYLKRRIQISDLLVLVVLCLQGSLSARIKKSGALPEDESQRYTNQLLQGIEFLHSQKVIHRDIKGKFRKLGDEYSVCVFLN